MKKLFLFLLFGPFLIQASAQVQELETFRKKISFFIQYDGGKSDSLPKTEAHTARLRKELEESFVQFASHRQTHNLESLKASSKFKSGNTYTFDTYGYFLGELPRDMTKRSRINNINFSIGFYGLYNYKRPNFVYVFIQPFRVNNNQFLVYSYDLNGKGLYFIKDSATNAILYRGESRTSSATLYAIQEIDARHYLLVEDMEDRGRRALVLEKTAKGLQAIPAFKGKGFEEDTDNFKQKAQRERRKYMWLASNRSFSVQYSTKYVEIGFDETKKTIFYTKYVNETKGDIRRIESAWKGTYFEIDDYYLGESMNDSPIPMPD